jgi:glycerol-3-phosphate dehydrogenase subunit C
MPISYQPTEATCYDPADPTYWDAEALQTELTRVFEVCHGCRMCFKYCDSFPDLFSFIDAHDGDVEKLTGDEVHKVVDGCFQCKLCEVQCPYTPRDSHEFQLDFPKLMHRFRAHERREHAPTARDRFLGDPDTTGAMARASFGLATKMNSVPLHRWFLESVLGIHRDKQLPEWADEPFDRQAADRVDATPSDKAVLFQTCWVQHNDPELGHDTLEVMDRNQIPIRCLEGLQCCGMPAWERGDLEAVQRQAKANLDKLSPHVEAGAKVVAINPSCSMMMRREYPELVAEEDRERATALASAIVDPSEMLWSIRKEERFNEEFQSGPAGNIAYHAPCHLRAQAVGFRGRDLVRKLPGVERVGTVMECCGHDGTFAMTTEGYDASIRVGRKSFEGMKEAKADVWVTDCPLAGMQFAQHAGVTPMHPMTALAKAYRGDSFPRTDDDEESP